jgi:hypothetical protein
MRKRWTEDYRFIFGAVLGLVFGLLAALFNPLLAYWGTEILESRYPSRPVIEFDFVRLNGDGTMTLAVVNDGRRSAVIQRVDFCDPAAIGLVHDGEVTYAWDRDRKVFDGVIANRIEMEFDPPHNYLTCTRDYGEQALAVLSGNRQVDPRSAVEVRVAAPAGFSFRSGFDSNLISVSYRCSLTLTIFQHHRLKPILLPCYVDDPVSYGAEAAARWEEMLKRGREMYREANQKIHDLMDDLTRDLGVTACPTMLCPREPARPFL